MRSDLELLSHMLLDKKYVSAKHKVKWPGVTLHYAFGRKRSSVKHKAEWPRVTCTYALRKQARYAGNAAVLKAPGRAQWFWEVFSQNSIALLFTAAEIGAGGMEHMRGHMDLCFRGCCGLSVLFRLRIIRTLEDAEKDFSKNLKKLYCVTICGMI